MAKASRKSLYPISDIFLNRWSPRAMSGEPMSDEELMPLFEAARWAPSSYNGQPWRFVYAYKGSKRYDQFFELLVPFNQSWAKTAAVLVAIISKKTFELNGKPSRTHSFDTGSAWMNFALQGSIDDLVVHAMEGFDYDKTHNLLGLSDDYQVECMVAVGKPGRKEDLPAELQEREEPSGRRPIEEIVFEDEFKE